MSRSFADEPTIAELAGLRIGARTDVRHEATCATWYLAVPGQAGQVSPDAGPRADAWLAWPSDTGVMLSTLNWVARGLGFAWVGVLAFVLIPPHGTLNLAVQIAGTAWPARPRWRGC
jgi:hypothetical protein